MGIKYLNEHTSCHHYRPSGEQGYRLISDLTPELISEMNKSYRYLLFMCLQGGVKFSSPDGSRSAKLKESWMVLANGGCAEIECDPDTLVLVAYFNEREFPCDKITLQELSHLMDEGAGHNAPYTSRLLSMRTPMRKFAHQLSYYIQDGAFCEMLHEVKLREMFWILRAYYSREELAAFLAPMLSGNNFREQVESVFSPQMKVQTLADRVNIPLKTFCVTFEKEFNMTPKRWIQEHKRDHCLMLLQDLDKNMSEIGLALGYNSVQSFSRYCKDEFGVSPKEKRAELIKLKKQAKKKQ